jgi:hypothetical protein
MAIEVAPPKAPVDLVEHVGAGGPDRRLRAALVLALLAFVAVGCAPWQRACSYSDIGGAMTTCFHASVWSGNAGLVGALACVLALLAAVRILLLRGGVLAIADWLTLGGFCAAGWAKVLLTAGYAPPLENQWAVEPWLWLAAVILCVVTGLVVAIIAWERKRSPSGSAQLARKAAIACGLGAILVVTLTIPYQWAGLGRWGGPVGSTLATDGSGAGFGYRSAGVGTPVRIVGLVYVRDEGRVGVTLDGITLYNATPGLELLGAYVGGTPACVRQLDDATPFGALAADPCAVPIRGWHVPSGRGPGNDVPVVLVVKMERPGRFEFRQVSIRYHLGPLHFTAVDSLEAGVCTASPAPSQCPPKSRPFGP